MGSNKRTGRGTRGLGGAVLLAALLAGCTSTSSGSGPAGQSVSAGSSAVAAPAAGSVIAGSGTSAPATSAPVTSASGTSEASSTVSAPPRVTATVTRTRQGQTVTIGPPRPTRAPATVAGDCPYLDADVVSIITGQHHGPTQLVGYTPHPMCLFYRSDGRAMGSVRIIVGANPQQAVSAVNQHVPIADSQPVSQPAGWSGGSMTSPGQMTQDSSASSTYAVSKGNIAVVATENESPSIKARVMAVCAIYGLKLQTGPAPDYCSSTSG